MDVCVYVSVPASIYVNLKVCSEAFCLPMKSLSTDFSLITVMPYLHVQYIFHSIGLNGKY